MLMMVVGQDAQAELSLTPTVTTDNSLQYKTMQTIEFESTKASFREVVHATLKSPKLESKSSETYSQTIDGVVRGATNSGPTALVLDDSVVRRGSSGAIASDVVNLKHAILVINETVRQSVAAAKQEQWSQDVTLNLGIELRDTITMHIDVSQLEDDVTLVTVSTEPRILQGKSGPFSCAYNGAFVYSISNGQLYQSSSIFTARKGSEKLWVEEFTFLADDTGKVPQFQLVDLRDYLKFSMRTGVFPMQGVPPTPWLLEALAARESLFCAEKVVATSWEQTIVVSQLLTAKVAYAAVNLGTLMNAGSSLASAVSARYPLEGWIGGYNQYTEGLHASEDAVVDSSVRSNATAVFNAYALLVPVTKDNVANSKIEPKVGRPQGTNKTASDPSQSKDGGSGVGGGSAVGMDLGTLALYGGAGIAIAMGASGSSSSGGGGSGGGGSGGGGGGGGGGDACDNDLADIYAVTASAGCTIVIELPQSDVDIEISLNTDCTYTGTSIIFGALTAVTPGTWSYAGTTLTINGPDGIVTTNVAESAGTFTTAMRPFFNDALDNMVSSLTAAEIAAIEDECGSVDAYLDTFSLKWTK